MERGVNVFPNLTASAFAFPEHGGLPMVDPDYFPPVIVCISARNAAERSALVAFRREFHRRRLRRFLGLRCALEVLLTVNTILDGIAA